MDQIDHVPAPADLAAELARANDQLAAVYRERAQLLALVAASAPALLAFNDLDTPDWPVLYVYPGAPNDQMTWHIAPGDLDLFPHVPVVDANDPRVQWDGHTTADKWQRFGWWVEEATKVRDVLLPLSMILFPQVSPS